MKGWKLCLGVWALASLTVQIEGRSQESRRPERPNIVFLLADDLGRADVGWEGGKLKTPNLDGLAASGARLSQFYVQPVCSPTRAALMTGRYPMRHGLQVGVVRPWAQYGLPLEERTLPKALHEAGYETAIVGKWHLGHFQPDYLPTRRGFEHQYGHYNGALDYYTHERDGGFDWHRDDRAARDEGYSTHLLGAEAVKRIRERDPKRPLFLYVPFNAVHAPHQVPENYKQEFADVPEPRRTYAGMLKAMDEAVGKILGALDDTGMRRDTLVIFSSDNGGPAPGRVTSNGPFRAGKGTLYEGGVRVCACVSWPGKIRAKSTMDQPFHMVDWYPTLLKLAGARAEQPLRPDGRDVWGALADGKSLEVRPILLNTTPNAGAVRVGDWKLVVNGAGGAGMDGEGAEEPAPQRRRRAVGVAPGPELFNLADDPYEKNNLASSRPDKLKELREALDKLAAQAAPPRSRPRPAGFKNPAVWGESP